MLSKLLGLASDVSAEEVKKQFGPILLDNEEVQIGFRVFRDIFIFTDRRLLLVDKQGLTGRKSEYHTIPYASITHFSTESAGAFDMESELKIWVKGMDKPIQKQLQRGSNVVGLQKTLAHFITQK